MAKAKDITWVKMLDSNGAERFKITSDPMRIEYKIWQIVPGEKDKLLGKGEDPGELERKYVNWKTL